MTDKLYFGATTTARLNKQPNTFMSILTLKQLRTVLAFGLVLCGAILPARAQDTPFILVGLTNQFWKYDQSAANLGTEWRAIGYNDAAWPSGRGVLAFENQAVINPLTNTVLSLTNGPTRVITYYFRTHFTFTNDPTLMSVISSNYVDDGMVVFLNGVEAFRYNMPVGAITSATLSPVANPAGEGVPIVSNLPPSLLVQGDNVLAVEVHQNSAASSDIVFGMALIGSPIPATLLSLTTQPQSVTTVETQPTTFTVGVQGAPAFFQWYRDNVAIPNARTNPLVIPVTGTNDAGSYYLVATNAINSVTSSVAVLAVLVDTNGPVIIEADGMASLTNILISFSERINATNATNIANFAVNNTLGGSLTIIQATLVDATNVLLHTSARTAGQNYLVVVNNLRDISPRGNLITPNSRYPVRSLVPILSMSGAWRFYDPFPPFDEPNLGTAWKEFTYNEAPNVWADGIGIFYNGQDESDVPGAIGTQLSQTDTITTYFRTGFGLQASAGGLRLQLTHVIDDGGIIYLNGAEVLRVNLPAGTVNYQTPATVAVDPVPRVGPLSIPLASFRQGSNVVAVELHQRVAIDIDKVFGLQIDAAVQSFVVGPVVITGGAEDLTVVEGSSATFTVVQAGGQTFQWQSNNVNIAGATNASYTIPIVRTNMHGSMFRAGVSNVTSGLVFSTNGTLRVVTDTNSPVLLSGLLISSNNTIVLSFSEPMAPAGAITIANYSVTNAGGPAAVVTGAVLTNGTNVILSFGASLAGRYTVVVNNLTDAASTPNPIAPNSAVTVGADYVVAMDSKWKYLQINTNETVQSTFMGVAYDDSSWQGPSNALLYVEGAPLPAPKNTLLSLTDGGGNRINTYYFRQAFFAPVSATNVTLRLSHIIDDGMVLHLNGVAIYRFNMAAGVPTAATQSTATVGDAALVGPIILTLTNFIAGTNIFAVEVHQIGGASSDIVMGVELNLSVPSVVITNSGVCVPVQISAQPQSRTNAVGTLASFSVTPSGSGPVFYQWRRSNTNLVSATNSTYSITNVQLTHAGTYSVFLSNLCGTALSSNAVLTVTNPVICVAISYTNSLRLTNSVTVSHPTTNSTTIILSWANPVTNSCGSNATVVLQRALTLGTGSPVPGNVWTNIFTNVFGQARVTNSVTNSSRVFYRLRVN